MNEDRFFTPSILVNFLMLVIMSLPGILAFIIADEIIPNLLFGTVSALIGLGVLLLFFPLTLKLTKWISQETWKEEE